MHPICKITVDGKNVSGAFMERLISCDVTDADGVTSDTVSIELNDFPPAAIPRKGAVIRVWIGYQETGVEFMGTFVADQISVKAWPGTMSISGRGSDFKGESKTQKERHFDNKSVKDIVTKIAGEHGLSPKVDPAIGAFVYPWIGQNNESNLEFLERLAADHDALFAVKDGNLVFTAKGTGRNAAGAALTPVVVVPERLIVGSCEINFSDRSEVKDVSASWYDRAEAQLKTVKETADE